MVMKLLSLIVSLFLQLAFLKPIYLETSKAQPAVVKNAPAPLLFNASATESNPQSGEAQVQHLSFPAAAFTPGVGYYIYQNHGRYLKYFDNPVDTEPAVFYAPVQLPQGAVISKMTYYFKDPGAGTAFARLERATHFTLGSITVAGLSSTDLFPPSYGVTSTSFFSPQPVIDNSQYTYFIQLELPPGGQVWGSGVELEYTLPIQPVAPGKLNVPPAAFSPFEDGYSFILGGDRFWYYAGPGGSQSNGWYLAPVNFPDGAIVTSVAFYWHRIDASVVATAHLQRSRLGFDTYQDMAVVSSAAGSGSFISQTTDTTIDSPLIDNTQYSYWVVMDIPAATNPANGVVEVQDVVIEYQLPTSPHNQLSIPAAGVRTYENGYDFQDHGRHLIHASSPGGGTANGWYLTPLQLPDGASIADLKLYAYVNTSQAGVVRMQRTEWGIANYQDLAFISTGTGDLGNKVFSTSSITGGPVDNSRFGYWLLWDLPANSLPDVNVQGQAVQISFGGRVYIPLIIK
jgi:hypothetical protein